MTVQEIKASDAIMLKPEDVADVLSCNPHLIRVAARDNPELLGFPSIVSGNRVRFPRIPFLRHMGVNI